MAADPSEYLSGALEIGVGLAVILGCVALVVIAAMLVRDGILWITRLF